MFIGNTTVFVLFSNKIVYRISNSKIDKNGTVLIELGLGVGNWGEGE